MCLLICCNLFLCVFLCSLVLIVKLVFCLKAGKSLWPVDKVLELNEYCAEEN